MARVFSRPCGSYAQVGAFFEARLFPRCLLSAQGINTFCWKNMPMCNINILLKHLISWLKYVASTHHQHLSESPLMYVFNVKSIVILVSSVASPLSVIRTLSQATWGVFLELGTLLIVCQCRVSPRTFCGSGNSVLSN